MNGQDQTISIKDNYEFKTNSLTGSASNMSRERNEADDARGIAKDILRRCNIFRQKNASIQPVKAGLGQSRLLQSRE